MPTPHTHKFKIEVDGTPLADAVDQSLVSAFVDDNLNLPDMFQLTFRDAGPDGPRPGPLQSRSEGGHLDAFSETSPGAEPLVAGEVTAIEAEYDPVGR